MRQPIVVPFVLAALLAVAPADAQDQNAAELYRRALRTTPTDQQVVERIRKWDEIPIDEARKLAAAHDQPLKLVSQAAAAKQVDWHLDETKPDLSFLTPLRTLSGLAGLQARIRAADGNAAEAIEGLMDLAVMARRVQQMPRMVARLTGNATQISALEDAAPYIPALDASRVKSVLDRLEQLPQVPPIEAAVAAEQKTAQAAPPAEARAALERLTQATREVDKAAEATRTMFRAALAHRTGGEQALAKVKDPFGDGPFSIQKWDGGYELSSKLVVRGQPVTLTVGKPKPGN